MSANLCENCQRPISEGERFCRPCIDHIAAFALHVIDVGERLRREIGPEKSGARVRLVIAAEEALEQSGHRRHERPVQGCQFCYTDALAE